MFTGIVQGIARLLEASPLDGVEKFRSFRVAFPNRALEGISRGASIAINGVCLTVTEFDQTKSIACFDAIEETLNKTNLSRLHAGDKVNFERAARIGDEIGGHLMSGHIYTTVSVLQVESSEKNLSIEMETPSSARPYLLPKGFVGLNGCSLTLGEVNDNSFRVHLIPETLAVTTFKDVKSGDLINLEIDAQTQTTVDTVSRIMRERSGAD